MSNLHSLGKLLVILGLTIAALGGLLILSRYASFLGKLPGDILVQRRDFTFYFPVASSIIVSIVFSCLLYFLTRK